MNNFYADWCCNLTVPSESCNYAKEHLGKLTGNNIYISFNDKGLKKSRAIEPGFFYPPLTPQLNGAVIGSGADAGTLGFSDIHNSAAFKTEHQSVGIITGGSIGCQFAGNMANGLLTGANNSGSADAGAD